MCAGLVACTEVGSPDQNVKVSSIESAAVEKISGNSNRIGYCGGGEPIAVPMQIDKQEVPKYINTLPITYIADVDDDIFDYSQELWNWVIDQIIFSMNRFEGDARFSEISERRVVWKLVSASNQIANIEQQIITKSTRSPEGASVKYTYLYNRHTGKQFEIRHLFSNRVEADAHIRQLLIDDLIPIRSLKVKEAMSEKALLEDTKRRLPDEILDSLDVNLSQVINAEGFSGLTISIPEAGHWKYLPESGYSVMIESSRFYHLLKPECSAIFTKEQ